MGRRLQRRSASQAGDTFYDLRPFMFRAPLLMQEGASLTRALGLFRQMGLHHILVAPANPRAIGFITRKVEPDAPLSPSFQSICDMHQWDRGLPHSSLCRIWCWRMPS